MIFIKSLGSSLPYFLNNFGNTSKVRITTSRNKIYIIPNRYEIIERGYFENIWWRPCDYIDFRHSSIDEFILMRKKYPTMTNQDINTLLLT